MDKDGTRVVEYTYDSWGKPLSRTGSLKNTLGYLQSFRYRGYIYDLDTGLYYLRSRYYSPDNCRFINADCIIKTNLNKYCSNDPIYFRDLNGLDEVGINYNGENEIELDDSIYPNPPTIVFNETITPGMRVNLENQEAIGYCPRGRKKAAMDCVVAVNDAVGVRIACTVDAIWDKLYKKCEWGIIHNFDDLMPGDLVIALKLPENMTRSKFLDLLSQKKGWQIAEMKKTHIGMIVTIDFMKGAGLQNAVYQSCSCRLTPDNWDALFYNDTGPNITALESKNGKSNWYLYLRPSSFRR